MPPWSVRMCFEKCCDAENNSKRTFQPAKNQGLKIRRPNSASGARVAQAGTWTPAQGKLSGASAPDQHRAHKPASEKTNPPKTSAKCPLQDEEREQEIKRKEEKAAELRKRRQHIEATKQTERAMEIRSEREALKQTQEAVQVDCSLMEASGMAYREQTVQQRVYIWFCLGKRLRTICSVILLTALFTYCSEAQREAKTI